MLELVEAFYAMAPPTHLKLRDGILNGTLEALTSGHADLAIGVSVEGSNVAGLQQGLLGELLFIYVVAPHHPLASVPEPPPTPPCCNTARWPWPTPRSAAAPPWACWAGRTCSR